VATFDYIGRDSKGRQVKGELEAANATVAAEILSQRQIIPIAIELSVAKSSGSFATTDVKELLGLSSVTLDDLIVFCRQMYALMRSGVPILRAINGLADSTSSKQLAQALDKIAQQLEGGRTLSSALHQHPKIFAPLFVAVVHVGENTGKLDEAFAKLAAYLEREQETRNRIKAALRYPTMVIIAIVIAMFILNIKVIPVFAGMFQRLGADLPWATQMLITSSNFFQAYWPHMIVAMLLIIWGVKQYLATEKGRFAWDKRKLKLPVVGSIIERSILSRFSHSFAIVLKAGVPMTSGLSLVADAVDNSFMKHKILKMRQGIESGESLLRTAHNSRLFTPLVLQMMAVGEETGRVDELLEEVADYYEREVDYELSNLTAKIEPILITIVAIMVLILALGIFTPMWDMMSAYKGKSG
jgi:MSHA biogenesis protein MshG